MWNGMDLGRIGNIIDKNRNVKINKIYITK